MESSKNTEFDSYRLRCLISNPDKEKEIYELNNHKGKYSEVKLWDKITELCRGRYINHVISPEPFFISSYKEKVSYYDIGSFTHEYGWYDIKFYVKVYYE